jgi:hypothetical protein
MSRVRTGLNHPVAEETRGFNMSNGYELTWLP